VLAHNLRAAFVLSLHQEIETVDDDPAEAARIGGAKIRAAMNG
jgi:hypothetical protein